MTDDVVVDAAPQRDALRIRRSVPAGTDYPRRAAGLPGLAKNGFEEDTFPGPLDMRIRTIRSRRRRQQLNATAPPTQEPSMAAAQREGHRRRGDAADELFVS